MYVHSPDASSGSSSLIDVGLWETPLFGCMSNQILCVFVALCPGGSCLIQARTTEKATDLNVGVSFCLACGLGCVGMGINRTNIRKAYGIRGDALKDCLLHCVCSPCAVCQEHTEVEIRYRSKSGDFDSYVSNSADKVSSRLALVRSKELDSRL